MTMRKSKTFDFEIKNNSTLKSQVEKLKSWLQDDI